MDFLELHYKEPDDNDVYANGTIETIEIPPCDLHSDGTWEEIDSIENDLPQWWKETNLWAEYEEHKTTLLPDTDKIEAWRLCRTNNDGMKYSNVEKDKEHFNVDTHEKLYLRLTAGSDWILPYIKEYLTKHNLTFKKGLEMGAGEGHLGLELLEEGFGETWILQI